MIKDAIKGVNTSTVSSTSVGVKEESSATSTTSTTNTNNVQKIAIKDVKIKRNFKRHKPSAEKFENKLEGYEKTGVYNPIILDREGFLSDGYITYQILKEKFSPDHEIECVYSEEEVSEISKESKETSEVSSKKRKKRKKSKQEHTNQAKRVSYKNQPTLYIYGKHPNPKYKNLSQTEYVFRVVKNLIDYVDIEEGDYVLVQTKHGLAPLCVTRTEVLDERPVPFEVKKVKMRLRDYNLRNEYNIMNHKEEGDKE